VRISQKLFTQFIIWQCSGTNLAQVENNARLYGRDKSFVSPWHNHSLMREFCIITSLIVERVTTNAHDRGVGEAKDGELRLILCKLPSYRPVDTGLRTTPASRLTDYGPNSTCCDLLYNTTTCCTNTSSTTSPEEVESLQQIHNTLCNTKSTLNRRFTTNPQYLDMSRYCTACCTTCYPADHNKSK